jgi:predicted DNA-binding antitoxin AbrB/MazE fold protein
MQEIRAIFENGVLRPLEPLSLAERQQVRVTVTPDVNDISRLVADQRAAMEELDSRLSALPDESLEDGFSSADHDDVLYRRRA